MKKHHQSCFLAWFPWFKIVCIFIYSVLCKDDRSKTCIILEFYGKFAPPPSKKASHFLCCGFCIICIYFLDYHNFLGGKKVCTRKLNCFSESVSWLKYEDQFGGGSRANLGFGAVGESSQKCVYYKKWLIKAMLKKMGKFASFSEMKNRLIVPIHQLI